MIISMFKFEHLSNVYIAYYIFKNIEKEITSLFESLKKEPSESKTQDIFQEFKASVDK